MDSLVDTDPIGLHKSRTCVIVAFGLDPLHLRQESAHAGMHAAFNRALVRWGVPVESIADYALQWLAIVDCTPGALRRAVALAGGWWFAVQVASRVPIDAYPGEHAEDEPSTAAPPTALRSLMPILVPIVLIVFRSIGSVSHTESRGKGQASAKN